MPPDGPSQPSSVLYICGMNAIRSPMAQHITHHLFPTKIYTASAGVRTGHQDPFVAPVMEEIGIDLSNHRPTLLEDLEDENFDLIITLAPEAHHRALEFTRTLYTDVEYWPTADPTSATGTRDQILSAYRTVRDALMQRIKARLG